MYIAMYVFLAIKVTDLPFNRKQTKKKETTLSPDWLALELFCLFFIQVVAGVWFRYQKNKKMLIILHK